MNTILTHNHTNTALRLCLRIPGTSLPMGAQKLSGLVATAEGQTVDASLIRAPASHGIGRGQREFWRCWLLVC